MPREGRLGKPRVSLCPTPRPRNSVSGLLQEFISFEFRVFDFFFSVALLGSSYPLTIFLNPLNFWNLLQLPFHALMRRPFFYIDLFAACKTCGIAYETQVWKIVFLCFRSQTCIKFLCGQARVCFHGFVTKKIPGAQKTCICLWNTSMKIMFFVLLCAHEHENQNAPFGRCFFWFGRRGNFEDKFWSYFFWGFWFATRPAKRA